MFSLHRKESPPTLQLYGKLPIARDYLRIGCGEHASRAFREWLDHAYSVAAASDSSPRIAQPMRFIIGDGHEPLLGCIAQSSDEGGLRPFPIAVLVERKRKALQSEIASGLRSLEPWWSALETHLDALARFEDGQALLQSLRGKTIEPAGETEHASIGVDAWVHALWPDEDAEGLLRTLATIENLVRERWSGPLRLPLVVDLDILEQARAWWRLLEQLNVWRSDTLPTIFLPRPQATADEPASAVFFRAPLQTPDASWLASSRTLASRERKGDFASADPRRALGSNVAHENMPALADSLHGLLARHRLRSS